MSVAGYPPMSGKAANAAVRAEQRHETEVKFRTDKAGLKTVLASSLLKSGKARTVDLRSVYYDTTDGGLRNNRIVLRVRTKGKGSPTLDVKWAADPAHGMFRRGEVEVACPDGRPDFTLFDSAARKMLEEATGAAPLQPVFETRVKRKVIDLRHGDSTIEVAVDDGEILAGKLRRELAEVEVEIKSGHDADLYDFAMGLQREFPLTLDFTSKSERGHRLVSGEAPVPVKSTPLAFSGKPSWDDVIAAILSNTLTHFAANWAALRATDHPESIHQLRVALRRMRSALAILNKAAPCEEIVGLREEARMIATALGEARECDVFRDNALAGPLKDAGRPAASETLLARVEARRQKVYEGARQTMSAPEAGLLVLKLQSFIARKPWRASYSGDTPDAIDLARITLEGLHKKARKKGRHLPDISDSERHDLRITLKNLRYASEFFAPLFGHGGTQRKYLTHVAVLQDLLGAHNDAATTGVFTAGLDLAASPELHFAAGHVLGWYARAVTDADAQLMAAWKAFRKAETFWD